MPCLFSGNQNPNQKRKSRRVLQQNLISRLLELPLLACDPQKFSSLIKLDPDQSPSAEKPYLLTEEITLIGRDPGLANLVLDKPFLEPLHAEIHFFPDGRIRLTDFNSTSGTYVNYKPISTHGVNLQHSDLIHFGSLLFRFNSSTRTIEGSPKTVRKNDQKNPETKKSRLIMKIIL